MNRLAIHSSLLVCLGLIVPACAISADAEDMTGADESALDLGLSSEALTAATTPEPAAMADAMVANSDGDDGCKTRVKDENNPHIVHVFLDNCTGRFGRHTRSGEITVTFSKNEDGSLHADHQSVWLQIDGQPATRNASADITFDGDKRHVVWHGEKSVTRSDGEEVTKVADHVIEIDKATGCSVVNGTATITKADKVVHAELKDMTSCKTTDGALYCPTGRIDATVEGREVTISKSFDGTSTVTIEVTKSSGETTREVLLNCVER